MLNFYFSTMGPGLSPDPNIYYRTLISKEMSGSFLFLQADLLKTDDFASVVAWLTGTASVF